MSCETDLSAINSNTAYIKSYTAYTSSISTNVLATKNAVVANKAVLDEILVELKKLNTNIGGS